MPVDLCHPCSLVSARPLLFTPLAIGKSYIAFKLIEDNPAAQFLWLSHSEDILRTQCESLGRGCLEFSFDNTCFHADAKLSVMAGSTGTISQRIILPSTAT